MSYYFYSILRIHRMSYTACEPGYLSLKSSRRILVFSNMSQPAGSSPCFFILCSQGIFYMSVQGAQSPLSFSYSAGLRAMAYIGTAGPDQCVISSWCGHGVRGPV